MKRKKKTILCLRCIFILFLTGLAGCGSEIQKTDNWTEESAREYQKELAGQMIKLRIEDRKINNALRIDFNLKEFRCLLSLMKGEIPKGYTKNLPGVTAEEIDRYAEFQDGFLMRRGENGEYEPEEETEKMFRAALSPDAYIKCESKDGDFEIHYFKDVYYSILRNEKVTSVLTDFEEQDTADIGYCDIPYSFEKEYSSLLLDEDCDRKIETWDKYTLVNCLTGEKQEYKPEPGTAREDVLLNLKKMFDSAKQAALEPNRNTRQKMVYESVKNIMEMVGTDLSGAKRIYEDLCWTAWTDIRSVGGYDSQTRTLHFSDMFGKQYTGYLNKALTLWKTTDEKGEALYEVSPGVTRQYSLAYFTNPEDSVK